MMAAFIDIELKTWLALGLVSTRSVLVYPVWLRPLLSVLSLLPSLHRCNVLFRGSPWRWEIKPESEGLSWFWVTPQGSCTVLPA